MSITTNRERVTRGLDLVQEGLGTYLPRTLEAQYAADWWKSGVVYATPPRALFKPPQVGDEHTFREALDLHAMLQLFQRNWNEVYREQLDRGTQNYLNIVQEARNAWAHQKGAAIEPSEAAFWLQAMARLLKFIDSPQAKEVEKLAKSVIGVNSTGDEKEHTVAPSVKTTVASLRLPVLTKPWREVIQPHKDVREGRLLEAEFVVNLADVVVGKAEFGYQEPVAFFERTYLTSGLKELLGVAVRRLAGEGGEPVAQLKTAFGGGKTHTMLALYHLARSGAAGKDLPGLASIFAETAVDPEKLAGAQVAVLVGTALDPTRPHLDAAGNGITTRTLWGELAAQLGGNEGYELVKEADRSGIAPGSNTLVELFDRAGPTLILIDELVAYARKLSSSEGASGGTFGSVLSFVQSLTEAAKRSRRTLVVASLPESEIEYGGEAGKQVKDAIEHTFGRMEAIWRPVSATEGFEIVRRRLFSGVADPAAKEAACLEFARLYSDASSGDFPPETAGPDYLEALRRSYPVHPEVFEQLYEAWATLPKFQRTRGVLRLMATVIHHLWQHGDQSRLIMPASLPLESAKVRAEFTRYLEGEEAWNSVIDRDVDGPGSEPIKLDAANSRLGQYNGARRVARTIFLASAPHFAGQQARGIEESRIRLGALEPNVPIHIATEALQRLAERETYLYGGNGRFWYDTRPNLNRTAEDAAARISAHDVVDEIRRRLLTEVSAARGPDNPFGGVHVFAPSGDVPDNGQVRLVVLPPDAIHASAGSTSPARLAALSMLELRGAMPRLAKNMVVFIAPDTEGMASLDRAVRQHLAWSDIKKREEELNLDAYGRRQARENVERSNQTADSRIGEAYKWLIVPRQDANGGDWELAIQSIAGMHPFVRRAALALRKDEQLVETLNPKLLTMAIERWFWKETPHIDLKRLWETFANYGYMERLCDVRVLQEAIAQGVRSQDFFGYASALGEDGRYQGLVFGAQLDLTQVALDGQSVLVHRDTAIRQLESDRETTTVVTVIDETEEDDTDTTIIAPYPTPKPRVLRRFFGAVEIDPARAVRDAGAILQEVVSHLNALPQSSVRITLEIEADLPGGVPEDIVRAVNENARQLNFRISGFEE